jgi:hypothetical protein
MVLSLQNRATPQSALGLPANGDNFAKQNKKLKIIVTASPIVTAGALGAGCLLPTGQRLAIEGDNLFLA